MRRTTPFLLLLALITPSMACQDDGDADANSLGGGKSNPGNSPVHQEPPVVDDVNNVATAFRPERPTGLPVFDPDADAPRTRPVGSEDVIALSNNIAVASDATTDSVYFVDLENEALAHAVRLAEGSWPGRLAPSSQGAYVILQGTGEVVHINSDGDIDMRASACRAPRGIAADPVRQKLWVACASSELVSFDPESLEMQETFFIESDLRDVIATDRGIFVSRFRAAEILRIDPETGSIATRASAPKVKITDTSPEAIVSPTTNTLWRISKGQGDTILMAYQQTSDQRLVVVEKTDGGPGSHHSTGYGETFGRCTSGALFSAQAIISAKEDGSFAMSEGSCMFGALPVDIDADPCNAPLVTMAAPLASEDLANGRQPTPPPPGACAARVAIDPTHQLLASTFDANLNRQLTLVRHEQLYLAAGGASGQNKITLETASPPHPGHHLFHMNSGIGMACASCHPEGGDDGHLWRFERLRFSEDGKATQTPFDRRTQNLRAGIEGKLHWDGEFEDIDGLMSDVFTERMGGFELIHQDAVAIEDWLTQLEPEPGVTLPLEQQALLERGAELFDSAGCAECHSGEMLTDYQFYDVGTGGMRKTPTLRGIAQRNRIMSDGCATSLVQRFNPDCGGGDMHGTTSTLSGEDKDALIAYLETL